MKQKVGFWFRDNGLKAISRTISIITVIVIIVVAGIAASYVLTTNSSTTTSSPSLNISTSSSSFTGSVSGPSGSPLKIGIATTLVGSNAQNGQAMVQAAQLAVDQINENGGVLGHPLQLSTFDIGTTTDQAVAAAQNIVQQNMYAVVGFLFSGPAITMMPYMIQGKVITIFTVPSSNTMMDIVKTNYTQGQYFFRIQLNDTSYAVSAMTFLTQFAKAKTYYIVSEDYGYAHELNDVIGNLSVSAGIKQLGSDYFSGDVSSYSSEVVKVGSINPDVVLITMSGTNNIALSKALKANPSTANIPQYITAAGTIIIKSNLASMEQSQPGSTQYLNVAEWVPGSPITNKTLSFSSAFQAKYGFQPDMVYAGQAYDGVNVLANAIIHANSLDKTTAIKALERTDFTGVTGVIQFTSTHDSFVNPQRTFELVQYVNLNPVIFYPQNVATGTWIDPRTATTASTS